MIIIDFILLCICTTILIMPLFCLVILILGYISLKEFIKTYEELEVVKLKEYVVNFISSNGEYKANYIGFCKSKDAAESIAKSKKQFKVNDIYYPASSVSSFSVMHTNLNIDLLITKDYYIIGGYSEKYIIDRNENLRYLNKEATKLRTDKKYFYKRLIDDLKIW